MLDQGLALEGSNAEGLLEASPIHGVEAMPGLVGFASPPDVRVDDPMDQRAPFDTDGPAAVATQLPVGGADLDVDAPVYRVGPHLCHLTAGDTRIACKKCG
eukprot:2523401-Amphidinium_carterae.1